jgi:hypothetical protein
MADRSVLGQRLAAQLLSGHPASTVVEVVHRILAVQAQDPRGARLAVRSRSVGLTAAHVDEALTVDRSVVITTLNRGTLHLVTREDYWWLQALTTPQLHTPINARLSRDQVPAEDAERGVAVIERALAVQGPLGRAALRGELEAAGLPIKGQAFADLLLLAALEGLIVRGPMLDGEHAFVLVRDWLGPAPRAREREPALGELARRYLIGHGPAAEADLARWAGITLGDARRGLGHISGQLDDRGDGLAAISGDHPAAPLPPPRLLGSFDPTLCGWVSREPIVGTGQGVVTTNGIFRPFAMVKGQAVATWSLTGREVSIKAFGPLSPTTARALETDARSVVDFLHPPGD